MTSTRSNRLPRNNRRVSWRGTAALLALVTALVVALWFMPKPSPAPLAAVVASRHLHFDDRADGSVLVRDHHDAQHQVVIAPGSDGFLRATVRTFARERKRSELTAEPPFVLSAHADGGVSLWDPSTQRRVELTAFGPTNLERFARLLRSESALAHADDHAAPSSAVASTATR